MNTGESRAALVTRALRGVLVGAVVCVTFRLAFANADRTIIEAEAARPVDNGVGVLVATVELGLMIGIPLSYVSGLLVAWAARLRRPWLVSLLGLLFTVVLLMVFVCATSSGRGPSRWAVVLVVLVSYAVAAANPLSARSTTDPMVSDTAPPASS